MEHDEEWTVEDDLQALREIRGKLESIEREWADYRAQSRNVTIKLVTEHKVSVAKAAQLSGHGRATITAWLNVVNADSKKRPEAKR